MHLITAQEVTGLNPVKVTKSENWFTGIGSPFFMLEISFVKVGIEPKITFTLGYKLGDLSCYNPDQNGMLNFEVFAFSL